MFWTTLLAYQVVWLITVASAGHNHVAPGLLAVAVFAAWRLRISACRSIELRLSAVALALGVLLEGGLTRGGMLIYAAAGNGGGLPAWILALWLAFALTIVPLFGYLQTRPWLAAALGGIAGPLAYLGAARGWHAVRFVPPAWHALLWLGIGWGVALPLLCGLARYWSRNPMSALARSAL